MAVRTYEVILHERAWAVLAATKGMERRRLFALLAEVKAAPFRSGDFQQRDASGRTNEVALLNEWLVTYWSESVLAGGEGRGWLRPRTTPDTARSSLRP